MVKKVKIDALNEDKIRQELDKAQSASSVNLVTPVHVINLSVTAENTLIKLGIPVKHRDGAKFLYRPSGPGVKNYKFSQGATEILLIRGKKEWFLEAAVRTEVYPLQKTIEKLILTQDQDRVAVDQLRASYLIEPQKEAVEAYTRI